MAYFDMVYRRNSKKGWRRMPRWFGLTQEAAMLELKELLQHFWGEEPEIQSCFENKAAETEIDGLGELL